MPGLWLGYESPSSYHTSKPRSKETQGSICTDGASRASGASQHWKDALPKHAHCPVLLIAEVEEALKITSAVL